MAAAVMGTVTAKVAMSTRARPPMPTATQTVNTLKPALSPTARQRDQ
jgi:hypothetical protein